MIKKYGHQIFQMSRVILRTRTTELYGDIAFLDSRIAGYKEKIGEVKEDRMKLFKLYEDFHDYIWKSGKSTFLSYIGTLPDDTRDRLLRCRRIAPSNKFVLYE